MKRKIFVITLTTLLAFNVFSCCLYADDNYEEYDEEYDDLSADLVYDEYGEPYAFIHDGQVIEFGLNYAGWEAMGYTYGATENNWSVSKDGKILEGYLPKVAEKNGDRYKVVIPEKVGEITVVGLAGEWLRVPEKLKYDLDKVDIYIPASLTQFDENCFYYSYVGLDEKPNYYVSRGSAAESAIKRSDENSSISYIDSAPTSVVSSDASSNVSSAPAGQLSITFNGKPVESDAQPVIENGRTLVPLRVIFELLGAEVEWNEKTRVVTAQKQGVIIDLTIDSDKAYINGKEVTIDVPAKIINNRTYVPVRFVSESMGASVNWDNDTKTVIIEG